MLCYNVKCQILLTFMFGEMLQCEMSKFVDVMLHCEVSDFVDVYVSRNVTM